MPSKTENSELIEAINRNTAATRSIAIYIVGFTWLLIGGAFIAIANLVSSAGVIGALIGVFGIAVVLFGIVITVSRSLSELKKSRLPQDLA
jgi:apolipoprotein N-acyltransferase